MCFTNYIPINSDQSTSRSGLYAVDLPGIDMDLLDGIARTGDEGEDIYATIYGRAQRNLISDVSKNIQDRFFMDLKLITRETSEFQYDEAYNTGSDLAGVTLEFNLPKYAKLHIISI